MMKRITLPAVIVFGLDPVSTFSSLTMASTTVVCVASAFVLILALFPEDVSGSQYANEYPDRNNYPGSDYREDHGHGQKETSSIWCFQCNSQYDENCANILPNDTSSSYYRQCEDDDQSRKIRNGREFFCRKIVQTIFDREGLQRVVRRCGFVPHPTLACYSYDSEGHDDVVCQCFSDACNSAPQMTSPLITALSGIVVVIMMSLFAF